MSTAALLSGNGRRRLQIDAQQLIRPDGTVDIHAFQRHIDEINDILAQISLSGLTVDYAARRVILPAFDDWAFREDRVRRQIWIDHRGGGNSWDPHFMLGRVT